MAVVDKEPSWGEAGRLEALRHLRVWFDRLPRHHFRGKFRNPMRVFDELPVSRKLVEREVMMN